MCWIYFAVKERKLGRKKREKGREKEEGRSASDNRQSSQPEGLTLLAPR
jgi:hypothetical protein